MDLGLRGRSVAVTGGSSGIGLATIRLLRAEGARVATCARRGERLAAAVASLGLDDISACDVQDAPAVAAWIDRVANRLGGLDALIAVAGQGQRGSPLATDDATWSQQLVGKVGALVNPARAAIPHLRRSNAGRIAAISSVTAGEPELDLAASSAGQAAAASAAKSLAWEVAAAGILINTVAVGVINTERQREAHRRSGSLLDYESWLAAEVERRGVFLGRPGTPEEVARMLVFVASPLLSYTTGATFDVSGGLRRSL